MKKPNIDPQLLLYAAGAIALLYVTYKATKAVGNGIDAVTSIPGRIGSSISGAAGAAWDGIGDAASSAWHSVTDLFEGSSVKAGTTTTPRTVDPTGLTFSEGVSNSIDLFDPRYYGVQGNTILPAATSQSGPGSGGLAVGPSFNATAYFGATQPLSGM